MLMLLQVEPTEEQLRFIQSLDEEGSVSAEERKLSNAQKLFCLEYVANGGDALAAARSVGYASDITMSHKNIVHKGCLALIRRLSVLNVNAMLPSLFARLYAIAVDEDTSARAAVDAINTLIDRVIAPHPKGPSTAIQINTGSNELAKGQAQVIISELWTAREDRRRIKERAHDAAASIEERIRQRKESDILATMSDRTKRDDDAAIELLEHFADGDDVGAASMDGGGAFLGAPAAASSIPPPQSSYSEKKLQEESDGKKEQPSVIWSEVDGIHERSGFGSASDDAGTADVGQAADDSGTSKDIDEAPASHDSEPSVSASDASNFFADD